MPTIFEAKDLPVAEQNGVNTTTLADESMLGTSALQVERIVLQSGAESVSYNPAEAERFLYVIRGNGQAHVGERALPLNAESVLWLEKKESFNLEAGSDGLEVLLCQAPASG